MEGGGGVERPLVSHIHLQNTVLCKKDDMHIAKNYAPVEQKVRRED